MSLPANNSVFFDTTVVVVSVQQLIQIGGVHGVRVRENQDGC